MKLRRSPSLSAEESQTRPALPEAGHDVWREIGLNLPPEAAGRLSLANIATKSALDKQRSDALKACKPVICPSPGARCLFAGGEIDLRLLRDCAPQGVDATASLDHKVSFLREFARSHAKVLLRSCLLFPVTRPLTRQIVGLAFAADRQQGNQTMEVQIKWGDDAPHRWDQLGFHWQLPERRSMTLVLARGTGFTLVLHSQGNVFHVHNDAFFRGMLSEVTPRRERAMAAILAAALQRISTPTARATLSYQAPRVPRPPAQEVFLRYMNVSSER